MEWGGGEKRVHTWTKQAVKFIANKKYSLDMGSVKYDSLSIYIYKMEKHLSFYIIQMKCRHVLCTFRHTGILNCVLFCPTNGKCKKLLLTLITDCC